MIRFTLSGEEGSTQARVASHVLASALCKFYCKKLNLDMTMAAKLRLSLDGDAIDPDTKFGDMDVDDGDQVDVVKV
jgi:hypothetical protein